MTPPRPDAAAAAAPQDALDESSIDCPADIACVARARVHELYREHSSALVNQLTRMSGCRDVAREVTQETFARLLRMDPEMLARIERPGAYLWRISLNLLRDRARSRSLSDRLRPTLEACADPLFDQVSALESRDTLRRLELAIGRLKPKTRDIFLAHRLRGLSYAEIAASTGLSIKGVEKQMSKAIAKIDRLLDRR